MTYLFYSVCVLANICFLDAIQSFKTDLFIQDVVSRLSMFENMINLLALENDDFRRRIISLEAENEDLGKRINVLEVENNNFRNNIRLLEFQNELTQKQVTSLEDRLKHTKNTQSLIRLSSTKECDLPHTKLQPNETYNKERETRLQSTRTSADIQKQGKDKYLTNRGLGNVTNKIAFTAKNSNDIGQLGNHQTIVFDEIVTNIGGRYNHLTGVFYADVPGVYVFFFEIRTMSGQSLYTALVIDGVTQVVTYSVSPNVEYHHRADSNMAVVHLAQGNSVWIQTVSVGYHTTPAVDDGSTFSGFLLYPD